MVVFAAVSVALAVAVTVVLSVAVVGHGACSVCIPLAADVGAGGGCSGAVGGLSCGG